MLFPRDNTATGRLGHKPFFVIDDINNGVGMLLLLSKEGVEGIDFDVGNDDPLELLFVEHWG